MNSKKQMTSKRTDTNLLDTIVPDINVPIMELSRKEKNHSIWKNGSTKLWPKYQIR